ncbi:MAG: TetR/AcrR family transcriptional regulator [Lachnospiraceae bacterium]|nr:TetR/AcrR family transcriptional regulator [Lachnospiraceae bacterium]
MSDIRKEDRRAVYTKRLIRETFIELLKQKPMGKISVSQLCSIAEISRSTFYLYYEDCYQILEELQNEFCDQLIAAVDQKPEEDHFGRMLDTHDIIQNNNDLYLILMRTDYPMHAFKKFIDYGKQLLKTQMFADTKLTKQQQDWLADYIIGADFTYSQRVLDVEYNLSREELIHEFLQAGIEHFKK